MANWWQHADPPKDPRYYPAPVPSAGVFDSPLVAIVLNQEWVAHIDGLLSRLLYEDAWRGTDTEIEFAIAQTNTLLAGLITMLTDEKLKITSADTTPAYLQDKLVAGDNVTLTKNNAGANETLTIAALPIVGEVRMFASTASHRDAKWLFCDGSAINRTTYAALFAAIGTNYGVGNGTTTFNIPDMRGRFAKSPTTDLFADISAIGGEATHLLTVTEMPSHAHGLSTFNTGSTVTRAGEGGATAGGTTNTNTAGGGAAHNNLPPFMNLSFCIYAGA